MRAPLKPFSPAATVKPGTFFVQFRQTRARVRAWGMAPLAGLRRWLCFSEAVECQTRTQAGRLPSAVSQSRLCYGGEILTQAGRLCYVRSRQCYVLGGLS